MWKISKLIFSYSNTLRGTGFTLIDQTFFWELHPSNISATSWSVQRLKGKKLGRIVSKRTLLKVLNATIQEQWIYLGSWQTSTMELFWGTKITTFTILQIKNNKITYYTNNASNSKSRKQPQRFISLQNRPFSWELLFNPGHPIIYLNLWSMKVWKCESMKVIKFHDFI